MRAARLLIVALAVLWSAAAFAQAQFPTPSGNINAPGGVIMCPTASGNYVPCGAPGALPLPIVNLTIPPQLAHIGVTALGNSLVVKQTKGSLAGFNCTGIAGGAAGFCIAYNSASVPGTGALTGAQMIDACYFDTSARGCSLSRLPLAAFYSNGIVILMTSAASPFTYTTGTDTGFISADYN